MLYLAFQVDLRDRYNNAEWLVYGKQALGTEYTADDILLLSEWAVNGRLEAIQVVYHARQRGARVIYVGSKQSDTDEIKRQLCMMGVYDFVFFGDEIRLGRIDELIENPRTPSDVREYLYQDEERDQLESPPVVDVFEGSGEEMLELPEEADGKAVTRLGQLFRKRRQGAQDIQPVMVTTGTGKEAVRKFVWPNPEPVRIRVIGDSGVGKSFLACQIATLCNRRELPAAVVESDVSTLSEWVDLKDGVHVYTSVPKKGYRVIVDTRSLEKEPADGVNLFIAATWPDKSRIERCLLRLHELMLPSDKVVWIINHYSAGLVLPDEIKGRAICVPHEPRQFNAARMKVVLAELDPDFAQLFNGVVGRISETFIGSSR